MRRNAALILLCCLALSGCGKPDYHTLAGDSGRFDDLQGRWLLINYWAEWCKPCIEELPELAAFGKEHAGQAVVFAVNFDGPSEELLRKQAEKLNIEIPVLLEDPAPRLGYERPQALPSTYVFGPDGKLRQVLQGAQTSASLAAAIQSDAGQP